MVKPSAPDSASCTEDAMKGQRTLVIMRSVPCQCLLELHTSGRVCTQMNEHRASDQGPLWTERNKLSRSLAECWERQAREER